MTADTCRTCLFWSRGGAPVATTVRVRDANPDLGVCEYRPPTVHVLNDTLVSAFPAVHASRSCCFWAATDDFDGPDGGTRVDNIVPLRDAA
jgi:hypothetical protein